MARKKIVFNNWPNGTVKGTTNFDYAHRFAKYLKEAVALAVGELATNISSAPDSVFGVSARVGRADGSASSQFAQGFVTTVDLNSALGGNKQGHSNAYARHFTAATGKTVHLDYGNLVEQAAYKKILEWQKDGFLTYRNDKEYDFLYNDPNAYTGRFTVSYKGATKSARPDFRVSLAPVGVAGEAIYDITSPGDEDHILKKRVNTTTLDQINGVVIGYEIYYTDRDVFDEMT